MPGPARPHQEIVGQSHRDHQGDPGDDEGHACGILLQSSHRALARLHVPRRGERYFPQSLAGNYLGTIDFQADQWPAAYRDKLFTLNFHGRRVNVDRLERSGSGYVGRHEPDIFFAADPWFRGIDLSYGPDGSVFVLDWSDTGEYLLSGSFDGKVKVWSIDTRHCVATHSETDKTLWSVKWLPKTGRSESFATAGANRSISFYREATGG